jgi:hypothetical protein
MSTPSYAIRCNVCGQTFENERGLGVHHARTKHGNVSEALEEVLCDCGVSFGSGTVLNLHIAAGQCSRVALHNLAEASEEEEISRLPERMTAYMGYCNSGNAPLPPLSAVDRANLKLARVAVKHGMSQRCHADIVSELHGIYGHLVRSSLLHVCRFKLVSRSCCFACPRDPSFQL